MNNNKGMLFVQARLSSNRLPKKVLTKINNKYLIDYTIERVLLSKIGKSIALITSNCKTDDRLYDYYQNSIESRIVRVPKSNQIYLSIGNPQINNFSFSFQSFYRDSYIDNLHSDYNSQFLFKTIYKPNLWFNIELAYDRSKGNDTYHFLMVRKPHEGIERNYGSLDFVFDDNQQYLFTSSNNSRKSIMLHATSYLKNNISLQMYLEYFSNKGK